MNETLKNILKYVVEVIGATIVWCGLDYFTDKTVNIVENLIAVAIIVLICNITDYIVKKFKNKK